MAALLSKISEGEENVRVEAEASAHHLSDCFIRSVEVFIRLLAQTAD